MAAHNSYFNTNPFYSTKSPNGELPSNPIDYDFNINAIKTLLMTSKVPESCVWSACDEGERKSCGEKVNYRKCELMRKSSISRCYAKAPTHWLFISQHFELCSKARAADKGQQKLLRQQLSPFPPALTGSVGSVSVVRCHFEVSFLFSLSCLRISSNFDSDLWGMMKKRQNKKKVGYAKRREKGRQIEKENFSAHCIYPTFVNKLVNIIE